jgi:type IV pilus assembly protein PilQ
MKNSFVETKVLDRNLGFVKYTKLSVSIVLASFLAGCTLLELDTVSTSSPNTSAEQVAVISDSQSIQRQQIGTLAENGVDVSIAYSNGSQVIEINTGNPDSAVITQKISNPDRLVLDIDKSQISKSSTIPVADNSIVSGIRIGSHGTSTDSSSNKGRIVIDLKAEAKETINQSGQQILVALNSAAAAQPQIAKESNQIDPQEQKLALNETPVDRIITEEIQNNSTARNSSANTITALSLESLPGQGSVAIATLTNLADFEFKKTAPSEYIATIKGASLATEAAQTLLAAPQSSGIRSVRPVEKNGDVILRVFAQPENELTAVAKDNQLVIRTLNQETDYLAQPKVEATLPPDKASEGKKLSDEGIDVKVAKTEKAEKSSFASIGSNGNYTGALISLELQDADIDSALRIIAEVSNLNIIASSDVQGKVTLRLQNVPWDQALDVILKTNGLDKVQDGNVVRIAPVEKLRLERESLKQAQLAEDELEPLNVKYIRVSYARVDDIQPLVKSVLSERGDVTVDARSNQLIIKDIKRGLKDATELVSKLDLRTPQVLLETQIVEANRSFLRDLGSQLGFSFVQSPETGNATGWNFPNSISVGSGLPNSTNASSFPASVTGVDGGSAIALAFGSADGTKSLDANISALEREGTIKIISRPSVATTNNKTAEITSNETISVLMPNGGINTVVGGQGGAAGGPNVATEKIKAGITLKVTPQASPDYFILMDIQAESSNFGSRVVNGIPALFERKATSTVLVSSGQTFAIGGIYRTTDRDTIRGVPFLKDIPVLGNFFSGNTVDVADEELLFFITPRIIEGSFDDAAMTTEGL